MGNLSMDRWMDKVKCFDKRMADWMNKRLER